MNYPAMTVVRHETDAGGEPANETPTSFNGSLSGDTGEDTFVLRDSPNKFLTPAKRRVSKKRKKTTYAQRT